MKRESFDYDFRGDIRNLGIRTCMSLAVIVKDRAEALAIIEVERRRAGF